MSENSKFMKLFKINLSDFHRVRLNQIDDFDYSEVLMKVDRESGGLTKRYLNQGVLALKQYYAVALLDPLNQHAVSKFVDPFWHTHILFTKDYISFCNEIFGGYIHHTPLNPNDTKETERVAKLYEQTLIVYDELFSELDGEWWPSIDITQPDLASLIVCSHQEVREPKIRENALFKKQAEHVYAY